MMRSASLELENSPWRSWGVVYAFKMMGQVVDGYGHLPGSWVVRTEMGMKNN